MYTLSYTNVYKEHFSIHLYTLQALQIIARTDCIHMYTVFRKKLKCIQIDLKFKAAPLQALIYIGFVTRKLVRQV